MRAHLSVIIPTLNADQALPACLVALFEGVEAGLIREVILSDGGSGDQTLAIADAAGAQVITGPASRGGQLRRGCAAAQGGWLLIVHADTALQAGWAARVQAHMDRSETPACFHLQFDASGAMARITAGWANLRTRIFNLPYGDQALLLPRALYQQVGGYPDQPLMEDVALARALPRITLLPGYARTSAARYVVQGWIRRGARNLWTLLRYYMGADPTDLARSYRK